MNSTSLPVRAASFWGKFAFLLVFGPQALPAAEPGLRRWPTPVQPGQALAVQVDDRPLLFTGQLLGWDAGGKIRGDARAQALQGFANLRTILGQAGSGLAEVVRINVYVTADEASTQVEQAVAETFAGDPVAFTFVRTPLADPAALVAIDAVAAVPPAGTKVAPLAVRGLPAPKTGAHATVLPPGTKTFVSGQADTTKDADFRTASRNTLAGLGRSLEHLQLSRADVAEVKAFFKPFDKRAELVEEIKAFFAGGPVPPVVLVEFRVNVAVEIEFLVAGPQSGAIRGEPLRFAGLPWLPSLPQFSRAVTVQQGTPLIFLAGLYGRTGSGGTEETKEIFSRLGHLLFEVGSGFRYLVKGTSYMSPLYGSTAFRDIRLVYYDPTRAPASSSMGVTGAGRPGQTITLQLIAVPRPAVPRP